MLQNEQDVHLLTWTSLFMEIFEEHYRSVWKGIATDYTSTHSPRY